MGGAGRWMRRRWAGLALAALVLAAASARIVLASGMHAPAELCDEFIYSNLAKNLADHRGYVLRGVPTHPSYVYPLLIAPAWFADAMSTTYWLAKAIGAVAMTLVAIPVFTWVGVWRGRVMRCLPPP